MAVELRCPKCRTKLKLSEQPEPDAEIECPKCEHVFACEENLVHAGAAEEDTPRKTATAGGDAPKLKKKSPNKKPAETLKKDEKKPASGETPKPKKRKKKKSKKRKTSPLLLGAIIVSAVMLIGSVGGALIWFFTKKSSSQEMMTYLPDECEVVFGLNIGHLQKYPLFYKSCEVTFASTGFKKAGDAFAVTLGKEKIDEAIDYVVQGSGYSGGSANGGRLDATIMRTKTKFDQSLISKMPGAKKYTANGVDYYTITAIPELGYANLRVFAPTDRLVVFCGGAISDAKFKAMLIGNKENLDTTTFVRAGPLGKQLVRGTVWQFYLEGKPSPRIGDGVLQKSDGDDEKEFRKEVDSIQQGSKGGGYKASVGSREIRGEWITWYKDSETASNQVKKWKDKEWIKDDEKELPRWWKSVANKTGAGKTAPNALKDYLSFKANGETFSVSVALETNSLKNSIGGLVGVFTGSTPGGGGGMPGGGMPGGGMPGGGMPGGGMPGGGVPGGPPGGPPKQRRRLLVRRVRTGPIVNAAPTMRK